MSDRDVFQNTCLPQLQELPLGNENYCNVISGKNYQLFL